MLKSLNISELEKTSAELSHWLGAELQIVAGSRSEVGIFLWKKSTGIWVWFDLHNSCPLVILSGSKKVPRKKGGLPIHNFLERYGKKSTLTNIVVESNLGRILKLEFTVGDDSDDRTSTEKLTVEGRLFPHGQNCIVRYLEKTVSLKKIEEIDTNFVSTQVADDKLDRLPKEIEALWLEQKKQKKIAGANSRGKTSVKVVTVAVQLKKKQKALDKINLDLSSGKDLLWQKLGQYLSQWFMGGGLKSFPKGLPVEFIANVNEEKSAIWNMENAFSKAKQIKRKRSGQLERVAILTDEISKLEKMLEAGEEFISSDKSNLIKGKNKREEIGGGSSLLSISKAKGRTFKIDEDFCAFLGRSGIDNLKLLRAAKPWFTWMHLKEFPGAHVVVQHNKKNTLDSKKLKLVFEWLIKESMLTKKSVIAGETLSIVVAEIRYVKPVKGAPAGLVSYTRAEHHSFVVP